MTANDGRLAVRNRYKTILGRNIYSQDRRSYVLTPYKDGKYYSDCSSSIAKCYQAEGYPITYGGSSLPSTVGFYLSADVVEVPVKINSKGEITNPEILCIADSLLFAGTDSSRKYAGYVGHVEMVGEISGNKITIYGHGSGTPRATEMQAYLRKRRSQKSNTALGHKGLIKVVRRIVDDGSAPTGDGGSTSGSTLGNRILKKGMSGADVRELQAALIQLGYSCGPDGADGDYGSNTVAAVKKFQTAKGLLVDGEAGPDTIGALVAALAAQQPAADKPATPATPTPPTTGKRVTISNCTSANIRTGPGDTYGIVGTCKPGNTFAAVDGWVPVLIDGQVRWISSKYAKVEG